MENAPKKGLSAYIFFVNDNRERISNENLELTMPELCTKLGNEWKNLSENEKSYYIHKADLDRERYLREKEEFENRNNSH